MTSSNHALVRIADMGMEQNIDKRRHTRVAVSMGINWGGEPDCLLTDRLTSLSAGGCFIQTKFRTERDLTVYVRLWLPKETTLKGQVRYNMDNVGIGVEFVELADQDRLIVGALVDHYLIESGRVQPIGDSRNS